MYSVVIYSLPIFWFGLMLQLLFGVRLNWLPISGRIDSVIGTTLVRRTNLYLIDTVIAGNWVAFRSVVVHLILPTVTLGLILSGVFVRLTRINVIETLQADYIQAGRARGLLERVLIYVHSLKNALIPIVTVLSLNVAFIIGGAIITESIFGWPGMGLLFVNSLSSKEYPVLMGMVMITAIAVIIGNLIADVINAMIDSRVRLE